MQGTQKANGRNVLHDVFCLYAVDSIISDLPWFMAEKLLSIESSVLIKQIRLSLIKTLSAHSDDLIKAFDIPEYMVSAPIAMNWVDFNAADNKGEVLTSKL